jgi:hypothetical protein
VKIVSFRIGNAARFGVLKGTGVIDISARLGAKYPDLRSFIATADWRSVAEELLASDSALCLAAAKCPSIRTLSCASPIRS